VNGTNIELKNGVSDTEAAPGSASRIVTRFFGNELFKDLNDDGKDDAVFLVTQQTGGSGTFFYVVAALATERGYLGGEGVFLGDRIAPQSTQSGPGKSVVITYADRAPGESFDTQPRVGKSIRLILDPNTRQFGEVAQNFEGEADPARMTLTMKTWVWISALYNDERVVTPKQPKALIQNNFVLQELSSGYQSKIYGKFLLSTGEKVVMQIKAHLVVDYINSKIPNTNVFVLGPGDQLYLKGSKEYQWHLAKSDKISSKNLVPGFVYWCATVLPHFDRSKEKEITESQKLYLGKIKMTGVSQRQYEMVDLWYDMGDCLYSRHALPKQQLYKFGEPEQNVIKGLKEEGKKVLVGGKTT
jgi:hypothetical protein